MDEDSATRHLCYKAEDRGGLPKLAVAPRRTAIRHRLHP